MILVDHYYYFALASCQATLWDLCLEAKTVLESF